jgi:hypothetical protein
MRARALGPVPDTPFMDVTKTPKLLQLPSTLPPVTFNVALKRDQPIGIMVWLCHVLVPLLYLIRMFTL